jgi:hypothetical protein
METIEDFEASSKNSVDCISSAEFLSEHEVKREANNENSTTKIYVLKGRNLFPSCIQCDNLGVT